MKIDSQTGAIELPNGLSIDAALTQDEFRGLPVFALSQAHDYGTAPWIHYSFSGGFLEGNEVLASLCFFDQMLVHTSLTVDLYPPGPKDWSRYSLDVEAQTKDFHDRLLKQMFGKPTRITSLKFRRLPPGQQTLDQPRSWNFSWGGVSSCHDSKGGGTSVIVRYGDRQEKANWAYNRRTSAR